MASLFDDYYGKFKERMKDQKGVYAFRGQEDADWPLESSACSRMRKNSVKDLPFYLETQFINPAKLNGWYHDREVNRKLHDLEILARFQHYGAATCLLDFTRSFHVALWFACQEAVKDREGVKEKKNGKVFIINTSDTGNFSDTAFRPIGMEEIQNTKLSKLLKAKNAWYWDLENLTDRVARQNSVFILSGNNLSEGEQYKSFEIKHEDKEGLIKEMEDLFDLRPENLFKDIFGFASINKRDDRLPPDDPDDSFRAGSKSYQSGDYDGAIKHYSKVIELDPNKVSAYYNRGLAYQGKRKYDLAIEDYTEVIKLGPNKASAYYNRGNAYQGQGKYDLAIEDYTEVIKLGSNKASAYYNRGNAYQGQGKYDLAIEDYTEAIELDPNKASAYHNRALAYYKNGEPDKSEDDFAEAERIRRSPPSK